MVASLIIYIIPLTEHPTVIFCRKPFTMTIFDFFYLALRRLTCRQLMNPRLPINCHIGLVNVNKITFLRVLHFPPPPAISHRNTRCVDRAGKYFLEYAA